MIWVSSMIVIPLYFFPSIKGSIWTQILSNTRNTWILHHQGRVGSNLMWLLLFIWNRGSFWCTIYIWFNREGVRLYKTRITIFELSLHSNQVGIGAVTNYFTSKAVFVEVTYLFWLFFLALLPQEEIRQLFVDHLRIFNTNNNRL